MKAESTKRALRFEAIVHPGPKQEKRKFYSLAAAQVWAVGKATRLATPGHPKHWYIVDLKTSTKCIEGYIAHVSQGMQHVSAPVAKVMSKLSVAPPKPAPQVQSVDSRLLQAAVKLGGKNDVSIAKVRKELSNVSHADFDAALDRLHERGAVFLYRQDNLMALTAEDERGVFHVGDAPRHLMYVATGAR